MKTEGAVAMRIVELNDTTRNHLLENLLKRSPNSYGQYEQTVSEIIDQVRVYFKV